MAYLRLYSPTTDSCRFQVRLSNPFNTRYYKKLRITGKNYGSSTSNVSSYVESKTARSSTSSSSVYGTVDNGMSAGRKYTLYAYAQAKNGKWYKAGSDTITMQNEGSEDLKIRSITPRNELIVGERVGFKVIVKNYGEADSENYVVRVYDSAEKQLSYDTEPGIDAGDSANAYVYVKTTKPGSYKLKFVVDGDSSDVEYKTYKFVSDDTAEGLIAQNMPLSKEYGIDIPGTFNDYGYSTTVIQEPVKVVYKAGINSDYSVPGIGSINFTNGNLDGISVGGSSFSVNADLLNELPFLGDKLAQFLDTYNFSTVTFTSGRFDIGTDGWCELVGLEIQDSESIGNNKCVFTRLTCSKRIRQDDLLEFAKKCSIAIVVTLAIALVAYVAVATGIAMAVLTFLAQLATILGGRLAGAI